MSQRQICIILAVLALAGAEVFAQTSEPPVRTPPRPSRQRPNKSQPKPRTVPLPAKQVAAPAPAPSDEGAGAVTEDAPPRDPKDSTVRFELQQANKPIGAVVIEVDSVAAPEASGHFLDLAESGFYDDTLFHRVIPDFVVQGGDPLTREQDRKKFGTGYFKDEDGILFLKQERNQLHHVRGAVAFATARRNPNTGSSQFYICISKSPSLDGTDTVFGTVLSGMDVITTIAETPKDARDIPITDVIVTNVEVQRK